MPSTRTALLLAPVFALLLLLPAPGAWAQAEDAGYIRIEPTPTLSVYRSKHYRIFTTLSRAQTRPYGRHMDAVHDQYVKRFHGLGGEQVEPMPLYLFKTEQQYERFLAEHGIDGAHSGGMFFVTHKLRGLATWVQRDSRRETFEVLQHEGFHQFAWHAFGSSLPVWLNEGLAQYFEDAVLADGRMALGLADSAKIMKLRSALAAGQTLDIDTLLGFSGEQWAELLRDDPTHSSLAYAQSWSLAYFLVHGEGGVHKAKLLEYLERLASGDNPDAAELMAFGAGGFASLHSRWQRFALSHRPDAVSQATERLDFLGTGLRVLADQGEPMPADLDELRQTLQRYGFRLRQNEMGMTRDLTADTAELYRYTRGDRGGRGERDFVLLRPDRAGLPPRITAPGLQPEPTLIWYRDKEGKLVQDIRYE